MALGYVKGNYGERIMTNEAMVELLKNDLTGWNQWRKRNYPGIVPDFTGANLRQLDLSGADLRLVELPESDFQGSNLAGADFYRSSLWRANLSNTNLSGADLSSANLNGANLREADLSRSILRFARLTAADVSGAIFSGCSVYGCSLWNLQGTPKEQTNVVITPEGEPVIAVDNIEIAQFVYLLLKNPNIRNIIDTVGKKAVLILGRFTTERKLVLESIRGKLRELGYVPILFDFDPPSSRDTQETIVTLAGLVRFIIADITDPKSIPQELAAITPHFPSVPIQPILQKGHQPWGMYDHFARYPWVLPLFSYEQETLLLAIEQTIIALAEAKALEMRFNRN